MTPQTLEAHRAELLQTAADFQAGTIDLAEVKRITAASRDFLRRTNAWIKAGNAVDVAALRDLGHALTRVEKAALPVVAGLPTKARLTKRTVDNLPAPDRETTVWDADPAGFGLRLLPFGARTYILQRRTTAGRSIRLKIGRASDLTADQAREEARKMISKIVLGEDPAADRRKARQSERRRRAAPTVADLADAWAADRRRHWRDRTAMEVDRLLKRTILPKLGHLKAGEVEYRDVRSGSGPSRARLPSNASCIACRCHPRRSRS